MIADQTAGGKRIERAIRDTKRAGHPAVAGFLTAGFPSSAAFVEIAPRVAAEIDVLEVGIPFSDPMADGVTIQHSSRVALEGGVTLSWVLDTLERLDLAAPVVLMSYLNPLLALSLEKLADAAGRAGVAGVIVPDLPLEESEPIARILRAHDLALIQLVSPVSPPDRLTHIAGRSEGFVYAITKTGTTGGTVEGDAGMFEYLGRVRAAARCPVLAGFGIRTADQVATVSEHADGVIVGSGLIDVLRHGGDPVRFLRQLRPQRYTLSEPSV